MWVYIQSERTLWTVGFYDPSGKWHTDSDHSDREEAAKRVHYLNGGLADSDKLEKMDETGD
jgi:hypothetical protein